MGQPLPAPCLAIYRTMAHTHHQCETTTGMAYPMDWKQLLASITRSVDEELRLRNAYLVTENRLLRQHMTVRVPLSDGDRLALAEIGQKLGWKALAEIATIAKPDTILA